MELTIDHIRDAADRLTGHAYRTPILTSEKLNDRVGAEVFFKAEIFQRLGAFKFRGAYNAVAGLSAEDRAKGFVAASSGNHGQALALAATMFGSKATILMPSDSPQTKIAATRENGGEVILYDRYRDNRDALQAQVTEERGALTISPFDHYGVMAGAGTVGLELIEQVPELDELIIPISGGGLTSGCAIAVHSVNPKIEVWGAEPSVANDTQRSLASGVRERQDTPRSIADGLLVPTPGELTFPVNQKHLAGVRTATDEDIVEAMRFLFTAMKIVVEPSGAIGLATLLNAPMREQSSRIGVILTGGNVDLGRFCELLSSSGFPPY